MPLTSPLQSRVATVAELFSSAHYVPAAVQRDYQWDAQECRILMADLDRAFQPLAPTRGTESDAEEEEDVLESDLLSDGDENSEPDLGEYFLGTMVIRPLGDDRLEVFDGLQRLTTLTVLLAVLRDTTRVAGRRALLQQLITSAQGRHRLTLSNRDRTLQDEIQLPGETRKYRRPSPKNELARRIRTAARIFRSEIASWDAERLDDFIDFLLTRTRAVVVETGEPKLARQIFVTTNLRGVPLDQAVLFKGQVIDLAPDEDAAAEMVRRWAGIQLAAGKDMTGFLLAMDFIERRKQQGADCLPRLADRLVTKPGPGGILNWTGRLALYAGAWRELMQKMATPPSDATEKSIWCLRFFKWNEWKPLALLWYADAYNKRCRGKGGARVDALLARRFDALHRRCMAITLADYSERGRVAIFARAIQQAMRGRNPLNGALAFSAVSQNRMRETLARPLLDDQIRLTLLRWLEATRWSADLPPDLARATVEHVLPRRPAASSQWVNDFMDEAERYDACHALGNLAIMDYDKNAEIENYDFERKKPAIIEQSAKYKTLLDVAAAPVWSQAQIAARTTRMVDSVWEQLLLPPAWDTARSLNVAGPPTPASDPREMRR